MFVGSVDANENFDPAHCLARRFGGGRTECSPADADRWRELKRHITRIKDGLDLARSAPQTKEIVGKALQHVRLGSARKPRKPDKETLELVRFGSL